MIFLCPFSHCKALRTAMYKRYINSIIYTGNDKGCNLHAYVPAVSASLECSMDVQSSDGKAMLLKYVTSYVAKCHDAVKTHQLYSVDLGAYQAVSSFLKKCIPWSPKWSSS